MSIVIPDDKDLGRAPADKADPVLFAFAGSDEGRDISKPLCKDANGRELYAPRGVTFTLDG